MRLITLTKTDHKPVGISAHDVIAVEPEHDRWMVYLSSGKSFEVYFDGDLIAHLNDLSKPGETLRNRGLPAYHRSTASDEIALIEIEEPTPSRKTKKS